MVRDGSERFGTVRDGSGRFGTVRNGSGRFGTVRNGSERFGTVRDGAERFGTVRDGSEQVEAPSKIEKKTSFDTASRASPFPRNPAQSHGSLHAASEVLHPTIESTAANT